MARKFKGVISTDKIGSECEFEFEVDDDATEADIEHEAREAAFDRVQWSYAPVEQQPVNSKAERRAERERLQLDRQQR